MKYYAAVTINEPQSYPSTLKILSLILYKIMYFHNVGFCFQSLGAVFVSHYF